MYLQWVHSISFSYTLPSSTERTPRDDRENTDRTPYDQKVHFIKIDFLNSLTPFLKKLTAFLKRLTAFLNK